MIKVCWMMEPCSFESAQVYWQNGSICKDWKPCQRRRHGKFCHDLLWYEISKFLTYLSKCGNFVKWKLCVTNYVKSHVTSGRAQFYRFYTLFSPWSCCHICRNTKTILNRFKTLKSSPWMMSLNNILEFINLIGTIRVFIFLKIQLTFRITCLWRATYWRDRCACVCFRRSGRVFFIGTRTWAEHRCFRSRKVSWEFIFA